MVEISKKFVTGIFILLKISGKRLSAAQNIKSTEVNIFRNFFITLSFIF